MSTERKNLLKGLAFCSPWLLGFCFFTALPLALSFYYSFCDYSLLQDPLFIGTENYRQLYHNEDFWKTLRNTFYYASLALPLGIIMALCAAMLLNVKTRGTSIYRTIVFLPSLVPAVASAMLWMWLLNGKLGLINLALKWFGISDPPDWLNDVNWAMPALVLMSFWGIGNTVVIYLAGLQDIPRDLYEAADLDGAGVFGKIFHVTIPMLSPVIFFNLITAIIGTLQVFVGPAIIFGPEGNPSKSTYFFTMLLYNNAFGYLKMGYASAMAWVQLVIILILTGIAFWSSKKWVHYQGK